MSKIQLILELVKLLQPYIKDIVPLVKQIIEIIKKFSEENKPLVGATDDTAAIAELESYGVSADDVDGLR